METVPYIKQNLWSGLLLYTFINVSIESMFSLYQDINPKNILSLNLKHFESILRTPYNHLCFFCLSGVNLKVPVHPSGKESITVLPPRIGKSEAPARSARLSFHQHPLQIQFVPIVALLFCQTRQRRKENPKLFSWKHLGIITMTSGGRWVAWLSDSITTRRPSPSA